MEAAGRGLVCTVTFEQEQAGDGSKGDSEGDGDLIVTNPVVLREKSKNTRIFLYTQITVLSTLLPSPDKEICPHFHIQLHTLDSSLYLKI